MAFQSVSLAGISIERLQTLCAVVEAGSIAGAAGPDPNRQSQFSRQLKELEKALGTSVKVDVYVQSGAGSVETTTRFRTVPVAVTAV